jgi:hypothetical protein
MQSRLLVVLFMATNAAFGQFQERSLAQDQTVLAYNKDSYFSKPLYLIDIPTASILRGGDIRTSLRLYERGGMLGRLSVGISARMMFGVSFGGLNIIGSEDVEWNKTAGINFSYRLLEETLSIPALVLGVDTQGYGPYWEKIQNDVDRSATDGEAEQKMSERYTNKSKGFYAVVSKGYASWLKTSLHAGANLSLEQSDGDKDPDLFVGLDVLLSRDVAFYCEYDFAINDDQVRGVNNGKGLLNAGLRWAFSESVYIEFNVKDLIAEKTSDGNSSRVLRIAYHGKVY